MFFIVIEFSPSPLSDPMTYDLDLLLVCLFSLLLSLLSLSLLLSLRPRESLRDLERRLSLETFLSFSSSLWIGPNTRKKTGFFSMREEKSLLLDMDT